MKVLDLPLLGNLDDLAQGIGTLGSELITNGGFATDTDWTKGGTWTISGGKASSTGGNSNLYQNVGAVAGIHYELTIDVDTLSAGSLVVGLGGDADTNVSITSTGTKTVYFIGGAGVNGNLVITTTGSPNATIDNVSLKQFTPTGAMDRGSAGTYINRLGLLKTAWGNRTQLIDTSAQNDLTTWWTITQGANSVAGGIVADTNLGSHYISRSNVLTVGVSNVLSLKAKAGEVNWVYLKFRLGGEATYTYFDLVNGVVGSDTNDYSGISGPDSNGYYRCYIVHNIESDTADRTMSIYAAISNGSVAFAGDDASVSVYVKEIMLEALPSGNVIGDDLFDQETLGSDLITNGDFADWTADNPDDWTVVAEDANNYVTESSGTARIVSDASTAVAINQTLTTVVGTVYKLTFDIVVNVAGWRLLLVDTYGNIISLNETAGGSKTYYFLARTTAPILYFYRKPAVSSDYTIDNVVCKSVTAPAKGIPANDPWPALAGAEAITAQNDRDFSSGTIGNWLVEADGAGTCTYDGTNPGGEKVAKLVSNPGGVGAADTYLYGKISTTFLSLTADTLYKISAKIYVPAANTLKSVRIEFDGVSGDNPGIVQETLSGDTWTEVSFYNYMAADIIGIFRIGFDGDPADDDTLYFDDISIRPVQFSWIPYGTNTIEIDEVEDALKVTFDNNPSGALLDVNDAADLSSDLTVGESYLLQLDAKVGSGDTVQIYFGVTDYVYTGYIAESWTTYKFVYSAEHAQNVNLFFASMGAGEVIYIRNMSLKTIPDLAMLEPSDFVNSATIPAKTRHEVAGLLLEGEATNICLYSEDLSQWSRVRVKASYGSVIGPRGITNVLCGITADETSTAVKYTLKYIQAEQVLDNTVHCFSVFLKAGTKEWAQLWIEGKDDAGHACSFRLVGDGTVGTEVSVDGNAGMVAIGNGWYRCWVSSNMDSGAVPPSVRVYGLEGDNDQAVDTTDGDVMTYSYGAQLEQGSFPTSYIPTTTCPVTRLSEAADAANNGVSWDMLSQLTDQLVEELGAELVSNNDFATDTVWVKGTGWTISGGVAVGTAASGMIYQSVDLADGELYRCEVEIVSRTAGNVTFYVNGEASESFNTVGVHVMYIYAGTANTNLGVNANGFTGTIDNVYFKKVTRQSKGTLLLDWTPRYSEAEGTGTVGIVACRDGAASLFYTGHAQSVGAYDQVTAAIRNLTWERNVTYEAAVRFGFITDDIQQFEVGIREPEQLGAELIANGDMETGSGDPWLPTTWINYNMEAGESAQISGPQHSGNYALHLDVNIADEGIKTHVITTVTSTQYKVSFWAKRLGGAGSLRVWMTEGDGVGASFQEDISAGYENMRQYVKYFTELSGGALASLWLYSTGGDAEWYIDDVSIKAVVKTGDYQWGTADTYDGSFLLGSKFRLSYDNIFPQNIRNLKIYDTVYSQAQIAAGGLDGKQIPRKWFFGNWRQR